MSKNLHVIPSEQGWAVKNEGSQRITSTHRTQAEAIDVARKLAKKQQSEMVIHRSDGRIRERASYGNDPLPPMSPPKILFPLARTTTSRKLIREAVRTVIRATANKVPENNGSEATVYQQNDRTSA